MSYKDQKKRKEARDKWKRENPNYWQDYYSEDELRRSHKIESSKQWNVEHKDQVHKIQKRWRDNEILKAMQERRKQKLLEQLEHEASQDEWRYIL